MTSTTLGFSRLIRWLWPVRDADPEPLPNVIFSEESGTGSSCGLEFAINAARSVQDLPPMELDPRISDFAETRAARLAFVCGDLEKADRIDRGDPQNCLFTDSPVCEWREIGARGQHGPHQVVRDMQIVPSSREVLMGVSRRFGVGKAEGPDGMTYWIAVFVK